MASELTSDSALHGYLLILRRHLAWVTVPAFLGLAGGVAIPFAQPKQYSATAQILVQASGVAGIPGGSQSPVTPTDVQTLQQLVVSAPVRAAVSRRLGSAPAVTTSQIAQTNMIAVTATQREPAMAARLANAYARAFVSYQQTMAIKNLTNAEKQIRSQIRALSTQIQALHSSPRVAQVAALYNQETILKGQLAQLSVSGASQINSVELVTPATQPASPSSPGPLEDGALGLTAGLLLGICAAFLRSSLNDALDSKEVVERLAGWPVLVMVPAFTSWKKRNRALLVSQSSPTSPTAEAYRSLRTSLQFARQERSLRVLVVTSPSAGEGKTCTAANLGLAFAQAGERALIVSCDLRRPRVCEFFGLTEQAGLTSVLLQSQALADVVQPVPDQPNLWVLGAGPLPPNPAEVLNGTAVRDLFAQLPGQFDLVIVDTPPVLPVTDATILSAFADGVLLLAAAGRTRRGELRRAAEKLRQVHAPVVGVVLNEVTKQVGYDYGYSYGDNYGYRSLEPSLKRIRGNGHHASSRASDTQ